MAAERLHPRLRLQYNISRSLSVMDFCRWRSQCPRCWGRGDLPQGWEHHISLTALASRFVPLHKLRPLMGCRQGGEAHRTLLVLHMLLAGLCPWLAFTVLLRVDNRTQLPEVEGLTPWALRGSNSPDGHLWSISVTSRQFASGLTQPGAAHPEGSPWGQVQPIQEGLPGDRCGPARRVPLQRGEAQAGGPPWGQVRLSQEGLPGDRCGPSSRLQNHGIHSCPPLVLPS